VTTAVGRTFSPHGSVRLDASLIGALLVTDAVGISVDAARGGIGHPAQVVGLAVVAVGCSAAFWWRRSRPLLLFGVVVVAWVIAAQLHDRLLLTERTGLQLVLAVYALGSWSQRRRFAAVVAAALALLAGFGTASDGKGFVTMVSIPVALIGAPWFAGWAARMRRQHLADVEQRLDRAETELDERARLAVAEERARIARELHDVVAHHISLIGVQAGAARTTLGRDAEGTREALTGIESSSRDAVKEMRHLLDALGSPGETPLAPAPGLDEFGRLCDTYLAAGLIVQRSTSGSLDHLPPLQALTLYRIAEEALTNITRHSAASTCTLLLHADEHEGRLIVTDPGPRRPSAPVPPPGAGRGLIGMRQRVDLFGGTLVAVRVEGGGFLVDATLALVTQ
jgi:signal transduction histidine kinase